MYVHVLEICLNVQNSVWLKNPEHWKIVTSKKSTNVWFISQSTLSDSSWLLNWLRKSDKSSFELSGYPLVLGDWLLLILGEGRCWLFGILKTRESGLLHSCHYSSVKKTAWKIQWPAIWVWTKPVPTNSSKFYLNQSQQIHLNSTKEQSFSFNLKFLCANFSAKIWAFSESEWFSLNVGSWRCPGPWFNIKMSFYQYRWSHCWDKTILWSSYLHNGISI